MCQLYQTVMQPPQCDHDRMFSAREYEHLCCPCCTESARENIIILDDDSLRCDTCGKIWRVEE